MSIIKEAVLCDNLSIIEGPLGKVEFKPMTKGGYFCVEGTIGTREYISSIKDVVIWHRFKYYLNSPAMISFLQKNMKKGHIVKVFGKNDYDVYTPRGATKQLRVHFVRVAAIKCKTSDRMPGPEENVLEPNFPDDF